ncbi:hypothetical protein SBV1_2570003 [Verrucomicrobia bacterium]|nr:hypothetical protein SBV1_2570003 [Verrucomicrobiota bacterium]
MARSPGVPKKGGRTDRTDLTDPTNRTMRAGIDCVEQRPCSNCFDVASPEYAHLIKNLA